MTDDVRFRSLTNGSEPMEFTRPSSCKEDVRRYFSGLSADWKMNFYRVVALSQVSSEHKRTGKTLETPKADFFRFDTGKICEFFEFFDTAGAITAATRK